MVTYTSLQAAIDAGTTNMTAVRNNSGNDDGTDTVASGITWFYFNGVQVTNLYVSGNSWIGFGASSEQLKVNRRDAKVWYEWTETGTIGANKFFKLRWTGYSAYAQTSDAYAQGFDVFLFDNGQIFLNFYDVPTSSFDGVNALICGSETVSYTPTISTTGEWTFTPSDVSKGMGWAVAIGRPEIFTHHKLFGSAIYTITGITGVVNSSLIGWDESKPTGTTVNVSVSTDGNTFTSVSNGGSFLPSGTYDNQTVYIKVELLTTIDTATPMVSNLHFYLQTVEDMHNLILEMDAKQRFNSSAGNITVAYDGGGTILGEGGPVLAFTKVFSPADLIPKPNQNDAEHLEVSTFSPNGNLTRIYYNDTAMQDQGHLEVSNMTPVGVLINVKDI